MILIIYLLSTKKLEARVKNVNLTIETIKIICKKLNINIRVNIIDKPDKEDIEENINDYNKRVDYSKYSGDNEYNDLIIQLNTNQISNFEKHRMAFKNIIDNDNDNDNDNDKEKLYLIMEDDVIIGKNYVENIENMLNNIYNKDWDILFTSLNSIIDERIYIDYKSIYKKLISKACYFVKPRICKVLYNDMNEFKLKYRNFLCKFVADNSDKYKILVYNRNTFIEGSKIGLYPSTINPTNYLYFNNLYIELIKIYIKDDITSGDIEKATELFQKNNFDSPDILDIMSCIFLKSKDYNNAKKYSEYAIKSLVSNNGYLQKNSEILNNSINVWKYDQDMLKECKKTIPKYI